MSITLDKYTQKYFGEFLKDDNINEICYNGDGESHSLIEASASQLKPSNLS
ncbi:hypothetical protein [Campylobacter coli]|uniref:hypothetical protein n=1 Tax=Campylobacter coli TaxID=195 RepID=UPI00190FF15B|nr:hypothetical protein [Campylobacter coli]